MAIIMRLRSSWKVIFQIKLFIPKVMDNRLIFRLGSSQIYLINLLHTAIYARI